MSKKAFTLILLSSSLAMLMVSMFRMIYSATTGGNHANPSTALNISGFTNAYICGICFLVLALIFTRLSRNSLRKANELQPFHRIQLHMWRLC
jgi:ABC-type proline/glycine betaine transport system permease subunit